MRASDYGYGLGFIAAFALVLMAIASLTEID